MAVKVRLEGIEKFRENLEKAKSQICQEILKKLRSEFRSMISRCMCLQRSSERKCTPSKCYPILYAILYPHGGYSARMINKGDQLFLRSTMESEEEKKIQEKKGEKTCQKN